VQGPSPGQFDYWHLSSRPAGRCGAVVACRSELRAPVGQLGPQPGLSAGAECPGQGDCPSESSESEAAVSAMSWAGA
jgi:hypothetical protein